MESPPNRVIERASDQPSTSVELLTSDASGDAATHDASRDATEGHKSGGAGRSGPKDLHANQARNANRFGSPLTASGF